MGGHLREVGPPPRPSPRSSGGGRGARANSAASLAPNVYPSRVLGRGRDFLALLVALVAGCSTPTRDEAPAPLHGPAQERVAAFARDARAWLTARFGPPRSEAATLTVLAEAHGNESEPGWPLGEASSATEDPPTIVIGQGAWFASLPEGHGRPRTLARWIFYLEWTKGLAPWLREGLSDLAAASLVAEAHPDQFDGTIVGLLADAYPEPSDLADMDPPRARHMARECLLLLSAATDGGEPREVRALLDAPPTSEEEIARLEARARENAAHFPSVAQLEHALSARPRASSTTAVVEAATARERSDREAVEAALARAFASNSPEARRVALYGLGRLGARPDLVARGLDDTSFHLLVTAVAAAARMRHGDKAVAQSLLDLAKDGALEEVPGRLLRPIELFDELMGYSDPRPESPQELSLGTSPRVPRYRDIERREAWLRGSK